MKNFKKIALGLIVGAMAIGFSAFTTSHSSNIHLNYNNRGQVISVTSMYYRIPADASTLTDLNSTHYEFQDGARSGCTSGTNDICSSQWTTTNAPSVGESPSAAGSPTFDSDNTAKGIYNGE